MTDWHGMAKAKNRSRLGLSLYNSYDINLSNTFKELDLVWLDAAPLKVKYVDWLACAWRVKYADFLLRLRKFNNLV